MRTGWRAVVALSAALGGCGLEHDEAGPGSTAADELAQGQGALVALSMDGRVGVLLDEVPPSMRARVAAEYMARPAKFWEDRARMQVDATSYRLTYRNLYYPNRGQLPLPPGEVWSFALGAPYRADVDGHDLVLVDYTFRSTLLSDQASVAEAERALAKVGGTWSESFVLPADPDLLFERTGYACMDEEDFPPNSVDSENARFFFDDLCKGGNNTCHVTQPFPSLSCVAALKASVGRVGTAVRFERLPWDAALADRVRVGRSDPRGAQLEVVAEGIDNNRLIYRYIPPDSCAIAEGCVGGPGWRRLLQFDASVRNVGARPVHLGEVGPHSLPARHNMFEFSACHAHDHFSHYGRFTFGEGEQALGGKRAFCLESVSRYGNNEQTPLTHPYSCHYQGIAAGWGDDYIAGIECQWIDVTPIDTSRGPVVAPLTFEVNPDGFLCEGTPILDGSGQFTFEPTGFVTEDGLPVDRIACDEVPGYDADNVGSRLVTLPTEGSYVTAPCTRGQVGPLRNCGFVEQDDSVACAPGARVRLRCTVDAGRAPQAVRVCEHSAALGTGLACTYREALAAAAVEQRALNLEFTCPGPRDANEPGGRYSVFTAPVYEGDARAPVTCVPR